VDGETRLDLAYAEDSAAEVDANVVVAHPDKYVEVQSTAEAGLFSQQSLDEMLVLARRGIAEICLSW
jgi:ribonuclease PH